MSDINKQLDAELKKDWHKVFRINSIIIAVVILLFMLLIAYTTGETIEKEAEVVSFHSQASDTGEVYFIIAKLKSGNILKIKVAREISFKKGDAVILKERNTNLFGFKSYSFFKFKVNNNGV